VAQFERHLTGDRGVTNANRAAYRELAAAGRMEAGYSLVGGDESIYSLTKLGFERMVELIPRAREAGRSDVGMAAAILRAGCSERFWEGEPEPMKTWS
jgi:hypothetical protein